MRSQSQVVTFASHRLSSESLIKCINSMSTPTPSQQPALTTMHPSPQRALSYAICLFTLIFGIVLATLFQRHFSGLSQHPSDILAPAMSRLSPIWNIGPLPTVLMNVENTVHYQLNTTEAADEWSKLVPVTGGIVYLGPEKKPYIPAIFHQLQCLDILRRAYVEGPDGELQKLSRHCLNYLRQMILCRSNVRLEPVINPYAKHAVQPWGQLTCQDWRVVYDAAKANVEAYHATQSKHPNVM